MRRGWTCPICNPQPAGLNREAEDRREICQEPFAVSRPFPAADEKMLVGASIGKAFTRGTASRTSPPITEARARYATTGNDAFRLADTDPDDTMGS